MVFIRSVSPNDGERPKFHPYGENYDRTKAIIEHLLNDETFIKSFKDKLKAEIRQELIEGKSDA